MARANSYKGDCTECGALVEAGAGLLGAKVNGRWTVKHNEGDCSAVTPEAEIESPSYKLTEEQEIVRAKVNTGNHVVVEAGAGAGKTSTVLVCCEDHPDKDIVITAFNRKIIDACAAKLSQRRVKHAKALGIHQLALGAQPHYRSRLNANPYLRSFEVARILKTTAFEVDGRELSASFLASLALRTVTKFCTSADPRITERHVPLVEGLCPVDEKTGKVDYRNQNKVAAYVTPFALKAWKDLIKTSGQLTFTADIYLKVWQLNEPVIDADIIFFDEAQDTSPVMLSIIEQQADHAQIVAVGDSQQSINEWMGAVNALDNFKKLGAEVCWLTKSFRFGPAIAEVANSILARIEGATLRIEGFEGVCSVVTGAVPLSAPKAVLTRTNAVAVRTVLEALDAGRKPFLVGGGADVVSFAKGAKALQAGKRTGQHQLASFLNWGEVVEYVTSGEDGGELKLLVKLITDFGVDRIIEALDNKVSEAQADVVISTTHKAKGLEWESVFVAGDFISSGKKATPPTTADLKLLYVAVTRAQVQLDVSSIRASLKGYQTPLVDFQDEEAV